MTFDSVGTIGLGPDDITWERLSPTHTHSLNSSLVAYNLSKLCNILFAKALHERLAQFGVTVVTASPGILRSTSEKHNSKLLRSFMVVAKPFAKSSVRWPTLWMPERCLKSGSFQEQGAATIVFCAVSPDLTPEKGGQYFDQCRRKAPSATAQNPEAAERLWEVSELMIQTHEEKRQRTFAKLERQISHRPSTTSSLQPISEDGERD